LKSELEIFEPKLRESSPKVNVDVQATTVEA